MRALPHRTVDSTDLSFHRHPARRAIACAIALSAAAALYAGTAAAASPAADADAPGAPLRYAPLPPLGAGAEQGRTDWLAAHEALRASAPGPAAHAGRQDHGDHAAPNDHSSHTDHTDHAGHGDHAPATPATPPPAAAHQHGGAHP
ncbi:MAG: hypothetical protein EOO33_04975 [Comamonadaceae bacterium]|nr:MAG: hypothetical protein EOO33_04975 [Comamonadaceae bacterium]